MVEVTRKKPEQPKDLIQITMDEETAETVMVLLGQVQGGGDARGRTAEVFWALDKAGVRYFQRRGDFSVIDIKTSQYTP